LAGWPTGNFYTGWMFHRSAR